jgi:hypothetical protein
VYNKLGQHLGVRASERQPQHILEFSSKSGASPDAARKALYAQERRLLGVMAEQSGYLAAELSTSNLKSSTRRDPVEERRALEQQEHAKFLKERELRRDDWKNLFPKRGVVYQAAKADPDLRSAILDKLMAGDFPGMPSKQDMELQQQQQQQQLLQAHRPPQQQHFASPSPLHRKSPQKKPRLARQSPAETNVMQSLDSPAPSAAAVQSDADAPALAVVDELHAEPTAASAVEVTPAAALPPAHDHSSTQITQATKTKAQAAPPNSRKPQPVRRPLNHALLHPAPASLPAPAARTQRSNAPDSARVLRETAYFAAIPGEHLTVPKPPASSGPANFPNSPFGKVVGGGGEASKSSTVRVVGKNGSIGNVPVKLMA